MTQAREMSHGYTRHNIYLILGPLSCLICLGYQMLIRKDIYIKKIITSKIIHLIKLQEVVLSTKINCGKEGRIGPDFSRLCRLLCWSDC